MVASKLINEETIQKIESFMKKMNADADFIKKVKKSLFGVLKKDSTSFKENVIVKVQKKNKNNYCYVI